MALCPEITEMRRFFKRFTPLNRTPVSDGCDELADHLRDEHGFDITEVKSGEDCLSWIIPQKWTLQKAGLSHNGRILIDTDKCLLHAWSHSIPFRGRVTRQELEPHLLFDPLRPSAIPFHYKMQYDVRMRDWGFSLSKTQYDKLPEEGEFDVDMDTTFSPGTMKLAELVLPGETEDSYLFAAHSCHQAQAADGLSGIWAGIELFRRLKEKKRHYTYRLLVSPEFFGAAAYLANIENASIIRGGVYLDFLGIPGKHALCYSHLKNTLIDRAFRNILSYPENNRGKICEKPLFFEFLETFSNDEAFYAGPGFNIPIVGFSRLNSECEPFQYPGYHSHMDTAGIVDEDLMWESVLTLISVVNVLEENRSLIPLFHGFPCLSRLDINLDARDNRNAYKLLTKTLLLMDGQTDILDLSERIKCGFGFVMEVARLFEEKGLVRFGPEILKISNG